MTSEHQILADKVSRLLALNEAALGDEYYYNSLPLCIIDAVFSIGVKYEGVKNVVHRYCQYFDLPQIRPDKNEIPDVADQETISAFCDRFLRQDGVEFMTKEVFGNRQRTSVRNGILKSEAVWLFAKALKKHSIESLNDVGSSLPTVELEKDIRAIPGQKSGISLQYFWMLAGSDELIKPDRMILRFLDDALGRQVDLPEAQNLLSGAVAVLKSSYPQLTPRLLDYTIWSYQRAI